MKKTIKIAHLYYDLMNLYGENGNVRCLVRNLEKQEINVELTRLTIDDEIKFEEYDIFYIGSGNNENFLITLNDLKKYSDNIKGIINDKFFIVTGNALNLFGKYYKIKNEEIECLNIFDFYTESKRKRKVGENLYLFNNVEEKIIGFENTADILKNNTNLLFINYKNNKPEGVKKNNFYGTYLLGPILIRNPHFVSYLTKEICKHFNVDYTKYVDELSYKAYKNYMKSIENI